MQNHSTKKFSVILDSAYKNLIPHVGVITKRKGSHRAVVAQHASISGSD